MKIDFKKVYDWVKRPFIIAMLKSLGFGSSFNGVVETLFAQAFACLCIKKCKSKEVGFFHSMKQVCPLAIALYVLVTEALGYLICREVGMGLVKGIPLPRPNVGQCVNRERPFC